MLDYDRKVGIIVLLDKALHDLDLIAEYNSRLSKLYIRLDNLIDDIGEEL